MKRFFAIALLFCSPLSVAQTGPEKLSEPDKQALLERLDNIKNNVDSRRRSKLQAAQAAFSAAAQSKEDALKFYLKCVEKKDFDELDRSAKDWRLWRERRKDLHGDQYFRLALQYQLRWAVLTMTAANTKEEDRADLVPQALALLDAIKADAHVMEPHQNILRGNAINSVMGRAYEIDGLGVEQWAKAPLPVANVFEQAIMPPLREARDVKQLRNAWLKRIEYETFIAEQMDKDYKANGPDSAAFNDFLADTRPQLFWDMEVDAYKAGDEARASMAMLKMLVQNSTHQQAGDWEQSLRALVESRAQAKSENTEPEDEL